MYSMYQGHQNVSSLKSQSISHLNGKSVLSEPLMVTLQREVENYTRKLEQQERQLKILKETQSIVQKEHKQMKDKLTEQQKQQHKTGLLVTSNTDVKKLDRIQDKKSSKKEQKQITSDQQILTLINIEKNQIEQINLKYNQVFTKNLQQQQLINKMRRDRMQLIEVINNINNEIEQTNEQTQEKLKVMKYNINETHKYQQKIITQSAQEGEHLKFQKQTFNEAINEYGTKKFNHTIRNKEKKEKQDIYDQQNQYDLIKFRLKKVIYNNKEKLKVIDNYQKNLKVIDDSFKQIKEGSGITDIEEITNTFIKSEEQNYSLYNYVDILCQEIDYLEDRNTQLEKRHSELQKDCNEKELLSSQTPRKQRVRQKLSIMNTNNQEIVDNLRNKIKEITPDHEKIIIELFSMYKDDKINKRIFEYKDGIEMNENNFESFMSDLELFINKYIEYKQINIVEIVVIIFKVQMKVCQQMSCPQKSLTNKIGRA